MAHVTRAYLPPTESFIHNQVTSLTRYRAVILCHHRRRDGFRIDDGLAANEAARRPLSAVDRVVERTFRSPLPSVQRAMQEFVARRGVRLVHFHYLVNARSYLALARRTGLPSVVSAYGYDVSLFPRRWGGLGQTYLAPIFQSIDCFLAMSEEMQRDLVALGCPEGRIRVHYHGVDTRRFSYPHRRYEGGRGPVTILCSGRFVVPKAQERLVEALAIVRRSSHVPFRLLLVGDGPRRNVIEAAVHRLGMSPFVEVVGHVPYGTRELVDHYRSADVFALASTAAAGGKEGIPGAIVEAMAAGLPIVSTRHGGIPSVVTHGREGLLVAENDVGALAAALEELIGDVELRRRLGTAAAARAAAEYDLVPATAALERIYDSLLQQ